MAHLLERVRAWLDRGAPVRSMALVQVERAALKPLCLLTAKPVLYVSNVDEHDLDGGEGSNVAAVKAHAQISGDELVLVSARIEQEIAMLDHQERSVFLNDLGLAESGLDRVIRAGYSLLGLRTFFTAGPKEARAWPIKSGMTASAAAGVVPVQRDAEAVRLFPDDAYDLSPGSFAELNPDLRVPGLEWGAAKAYVHRRRHAGCTAG